MLYGSGRELMSIVAGPAGEVNWAIFVSGPDSEFAGAVYCAGAGSSYQTLESGGVTFTLRDLSRLPACPPEASSDSLAGCVR
jgi:hypothetical protein